MIHELMLIAIISATPLFIYSLHCLSGNRPYPYFTWGLSLCFIHFGIGHFVRTDFLINMLPPIIPFRTFIIYATGIIELLIAVALIIPNWGKNGAIAAAVIFATFLPANIYASIYDIGATNQGLGLAYLGIRIPLQLWLFGVALMVARLSLTSQRKPR